MANIQKELKKFFESKDGEELIGNIVLKAINFSLEREMLFEDGKSEPGRVIEKKQWINVLDQLVKYMPHIEAAIRGCQADSASARNRSSEVKQVMTAILRERIEPGSVKLVNDNRELIG